MTEDNGDHLFVPITEKRLLSGTGDDSQILLLLYGCSVQYLCLSTIRLLPVSCVHTCFEYAQSVRTLLNMLAQACE